jgi:3-deoxy-D-manno-octulosonic-acid transferase
MLRALYTALFTLVIPLILLRLKLKSRKSPAYGERWGERFGRFRAPDPVEGAIWVHSVSVGETIAAEPIVRGLMARYPDKPVVVTTMTPTGSERVKALYGAEVFHVYAPYDLPFAIRGFLQRIKPCVLVVIETELWPNTIHEVHEAGVPVVLANARLSERSARGYGKVSSLTGPLLNCLDMVLVQTGVERQRFIDLGLPPSHSMVTGSIKYDQSMPEDAGERGAAFRQQWGWAAGDPVWAAVSTHDGEDAQILKAFAAARSGVHDLKLLLVPRHPERFDDVWKLCQQSGLPCHRRSDPDRPQQSPAIVLGDSLGEMAAYLGAANLCFMGGSLVPNGGHNYLEPASLALPLITGPHYFNFQDIGDRLIAAGAMRVVNNPETLAAQVLACVQDPVQAQQAGQAGKAMQEANRGALAKHLQAIGDLVATAPH